MTNIAYLFLKIYKNWGFLNQSSSINSINKFNQCSQFIFIFLYFRYNIIPYSMFNTLYNTILYCS